MSRQTVVIRGEAYLTIETVAECFEVKATWVEQVFHHGLLGSGEQRDGVLYIQAVMLDRMAEIRRLNTLLDEDLNAIVLFFETLD